MTPEEAKALAACRAYFEHVANHVVTPKVDERSKQLLDERLALKQAAMTALNVVYQEKP